MDVFFGGGVYLFVLMCVCLSLLLHADITSVVWSFLACWCHHWLCACWLCMHIFNTPRHTYILLQLSVFVCVFCPLELPKQGQKMPKTPPPKKKQKKKQHTPPLSLCHVCLVQRKYRIKSYSKHLTGSQFGSASASCCCHHKAKATVHVYIFIPNTCQRWASLFSMQDVQEMCRYLCPQG